MKIELTEEMAQRIRRDLQHTLDVAIHDVLQCTGKRSMPGSEAREVAGDQLQSHGRDKEAVKVFYSLDEKAQEKLMREALPERSYHE